VVRLRRGTAHSLDGRDFPVRDGQDGTTSDFATALFVGSTYGTQGITVAVRVGFDDNRTRARRRRRARGAADLREIMLRVYQDKLVGRRRNSHARSRKGSRVPGNAGLAGSRA